MIIPANDDRVIVNKMIRNGLQQQGRIGRDALEASILKNRGLSQSEMRMAQNYKLGDMIRFNRSNKKLGIENGNYYQVVGINKDNNCIRLKNDKKTIDWNVKHSASRTKSNIEVFEKATRQLAVGDSIRWTRNLKKEGYINSQKAEVMGIKNNKIKLKLDNNKIIKVDNTKFQNQHFDYAYALTVYSAQGQSCVYVIAHDESFRKKLTSQKAFYVILSRARENIALFVDNREDYLSQLLSHSGEKTSSLELLRLEDKTFSKVPVSQSKPYYDIDQIQRKLNSKIESVMENVIGKPNAKLSSSKTWRYGTKGSLAVTIQGEKQGLWKDFESGQGGNILQLIQKHLGLSFTESCEYASKWTDYEINTVIKQSATNAPKNELLDKDKKEIQTANKLWDRGKPINNTLAERYLVKHRGIQLPKWPEALRYLPSYFHQETQKNYPALMLKATNEKNEVMAVQLILLDPKTGNKLESTTNKIIRGRVKFGANVKLNNGKAQRYIAEGPETALSILMAKPDSEVIATLSQGNLKKVDLAVDKNTIFCFDNDAKEIDVQKLFTEIDRLRNPKVNWVMPIKDKSDFNDLLKEQDAKSVASFIDKNTKSFLELPVFKDNPFEKLFSKNNDKQIADVNLQKLLQSNFVQRELSHSPKNIDREI